MQIIIIVTERERDRYRECRLGWCPWDRCARGSGSSAGAASCPDLPAATSESRRRLKIRIRILRDWGRRKSSFRVFLIFGPITLLPLLFWVLQNTPRFFKFYFTRIAIRVSCFIYNVTLFYFISFSPGIRTCLDIVLTSILEVIFGLNYTLFVWYF